MDKKYILEFCDLQSGQNACISATNSIIKMKYSLYMARHHNTTSYDSTFATVDRAIKIMNELNRCIEDLCRESSEKYKANMTQKP